MMDNFSCDIFMINEPVQEILIIILAATSQFCLVLIFFSANSLDPDQARQNVGLDLNPNCHSESIPKRIYQKS